jgi:REP element-mobilizing transposase RayT
MMTPVSTYPERRRIHLPSYDYTQPGYYFLTLCTERGRQLLGRVQDRAVVLSRFGQLVQQALQGLEEHYPGVSIDCSIIMPNHLHAIAVLAEENTLSLHELIRRFKSFTVGEYRRHIDSGYQVSQGHLWQHRYHDIVIRNDRQLDALRRYTANNPEQWTLDAENPERRCRSGGWQVETVLD